MEAGRAEKAFGWWKRVESESCLWFTHLGLGCKGFQESPLATLALTQQEFERY